MHGYYKYACVHNSVHLRRLCSARIYIVGKPCKEYTTTARIHASTRHVVKLRQRVVAACQRIGASRVAPRCLLSLPSRAWATAHSCDARMYIVGISQSCMVTSTGARWLIFTFKSLGNRPLRTATQRHVVGPIDRASVL